MYIMDVTVSKWGNSLGIRIPKSVSQDLHLREGSAISLEPRRNGYFLCVAQPRVSYLIEDLVEQMQGEPEADVVDWGEPFGEEIW